MGVVVFFFFFFFFSRAGWGVVVVWKNARGKGMGVAE